MATLAEVLRQAGYVTPQGQVVGPRTDLAQKLKSYVMNIPQNAAQNLANQRADIDAALTMGQGGIEVGDRAAFERQMAQVPNLMGATIPIYHSTTVEAAENIARRGFDPRKSYDTTAWFTTSEKPLETGASGSGAVVKRLIDEDKLKLATPEDVDKYFIDQLISQGYQGVKYPKSGPKGDETYYQMFYPEKLQQEKTLQNIVDPIRAKGITLDIYEPTKNPNKLVLSKIEVPKQMRQKGVGTEAMQDLTQYADEQGKTMALSPSTDFGATSVTRLKDFYKRFGFVENKGRNKDFSISESMYRLPAKTTRKEIIEQELEKVAK